MFQRSTIKKIYKKLTSLAFSKTRFIKPLTMGTITYSAAFFYQKLNSTEISISSPPLSADQQALIAKLEQDYQQLDIHIKCILENRFSLDMKKQLAFLAFCHHDKINIPHSFSSQNAAENWIITIAQKWYYSKNDEKPSSLSYSAIVLLDALTTTSPTPNNIDMPFDAVFISAEQTLDRNELIKQEEHFVHEDHGWPVKLSLNNNYLEQQTLNQLTHYLYMQNKKPEQVFFVAVINPVDVYSSLEKVPRGLHREFLEICENTNKTLASSEFYKNLWIKSSWQLDKLPPIPFTAHISTESKTEERIIERLINEKKLTHEKLVIHFSNQLKMSNILSMFPNIQNILQNSHIKQVDFIANNLHLTMQDGKLIYHTGGFDIAALFYKKEFARTLLNHTIKPNLDLTVGMIYKFNH